MLSATTGLQLQHAQIFGPGSEHFGWYDAYDQNDELESTTMCVLYSLEPRFSIPDCVS